MGTPRGEVRHLYIRRLLGRRVITGIGGLVGGKTTSAVCSFLWLRRLTPKHDLSTEKTRPQQIGPGPSEPSPPQPPHAPQPNTRPPGPQAPVHPPAPKLKPADIGQRIFHYSKCTGKKKALCVRRENLVFILSHNRTPPPCRSG